MTTGRKKISEFSEPREFNITGSIIPEEHYYVDLKPALKKLMALVEKKKYFVINRPRQFGKTTTLNFLTQLLQDTGEYAPALISFESFTQRDDIAEAKFYQNIAEDIIEELTDIEPDALSSNLRAPAIDDRDTFFEWLQKICQSRKLVLLIDEIDAAPETMLAGFLAGLREMHLQRRNKPAPHAVAFAGVYDIKNIKVRNRKTVSSATPFDIAIDYELPAFDFKNIRQYYGQHTVATGQEFDNKAISRVHEVTNGHPWLVSVLAKFLVEQIVPQRKQRIRLDHVEKAIQELLNSPNSNFDSLFRNARRSNLFPIVLELLEGRSRQHNNQNDEIRLGVKCGVFAVKARKLILGNHIYAQALYENFKAELEGLDINGLVATSRVQDAKRLLNLHGVLDKFQAFMKAKGAAVSKHRGFHEATGQLLLLSYLDLLVNGKGWTFKELQSGEGRIDVVCCYGRQKEVVELKLWYGERRYAAGLSQLAKYLDREGLDHGYLFVFDRRENTKRDYSFSEHTAAGKKIQAWVV